MFDARARELKGPMQRVALQTHVLSFLKASTKDRMLIDIIISADFVRY